MSCKGSNQACEVARRASEVAPAVVVFALALLQGGYYALPTCAIALVATCAYGVRAVVCKGRPACSRETVLLLVVAAAMMASAFAHGAAATMLLETVSWFAVAGLSLWCVQGAQSEKRHMVDWLALAGAVLAGAGVVSFVVSAASGRAISWGRLAFPFEYANTAGLFYAVSAVLALVSERRQVRVAALVSVVALLLTQSVGAVAVFVVSVLALIVRWIVCEYGTLQEHGGSRGRGVVYAIAGSLLAMAAALLLLLRMRGMQVVETFLERIIQIIDALHLFFDDVLFGIGPDMWQFVYPMAQSAQYDATVVHCGYAQVALDGGVLALGAMLVLVFGGLVQLAKKGDFVSLVGAAMIAVHAFFDFDLQFSAITMLLVVLLSQPADSASASVGVPGTAFGERLSGKLRMGFGWVVLSCSFAFACMGVGLDLQIGSVQKACDEGETTHVEEMLDSFAWLATDPLVREYVVGAFYARGDYASIVEAAGCAGAMGAVAITPVKTPPLELYCMLAQSALGDEEVARETLARVLHECPYNVELYNAVRNYIVDEGLADEFALIYNAEARRANGLAVSGRASWLSNQQFIALI